MRLRYLAAVAVALAAISVVQALQDTLPTWSSGWTVLTAISAALFLVIVRVAMKAGAEDGYQRGWEAGVAAMHAETMKALDGQQEAARERTRQLVEDLRRNSDEMRRVLGITVEQADG